MYQGTLYQYTLPSSLYTCGPQCRGVHREEVSVHWYMCILRSACVNARVRMWVFLTFKCGPQCRGGWAARSFSRRSSPSPSPNCLTLWWPLSSMGDVWMCIHAYIYIYIYNCGVYFVHLHKTTDRGNSGRGPLVVPLPSKCEQAEYRHIPNQHNCFCWICFLRCLGKDIENRQAISYTSWRF